MLGPGETPCLHLSFYPPISKGQRDVSEERRWVRAGPWVSLSHRPPPAQQMEKSCYGFAAGQPRADGSGGGGAREPEEAPVLGATTAEEPSSSLGETGG